VQVNPVAPPIIESIPGQAVNIGKTFTLDLASYASDPNTPSLPLTFSLGAGGPAGANVNPTTGAFTWTPTADEPTGPQSFTLTVSDNSNPANTTSQTFTVTVYPEGALVAPVLNALPPKFVTAGETLTAKLSGFATDPNTPALPLSFSLADDAPAGASIDPTTGILAWARRPISRSAP
jgi:large repetitive protein